MDGGNGSASGGSSKQTPNGSGFVVRQAERTDCHAIAALIRELAEFEGMPDQVKLTAEDLQKDGFDVDPPLFHCLVAAETSRAAGEASVGRSLSHLVGYALYFHTYSTWVGKCIHMEDLYVTPSCRGRGMGSELMRQVAAVAESTGCSRLQWNVLAWNSKAIQMYKEIGGVDLTVTEEWHMYRLTRPDIAKLAMSGVRARSRSDDAVDE